jgi:hypothetical protein
MKNIQILQLRGCAAKNGLQLVEPGIYRDTADGEDTNFRIAFSFDLEDGESSQYPLEDILDKYYLYVSDVLSEAGTRMEIELGGTLIDVRKAIGLAGKRAYNAEYVDEKGKTFIKLVVE